MVDPVDEALAAADRRYRLGGGRGGFGGHPAGPRRIGGRNASVIHALIAAS